MKKQVYILSTVFFMIATLSACGKNTPMTEKCIQPQSNFAYKASSVGIGIYPEKDVLPPPPWITEAEIPYNVPELMAVRKTEEGGTEIWISGTSQEQNSQYSREIYVYKSNTKEWKTVSLEEGLDLFRPVVSLYVSIDSSVWAFHDAGEVRNPVPLLSKYDEESSSFRFIDAIKEIPNGNFVSKQARYWNQVLLDKRDIFWFLVPYDYIYSYDIHDGDVSRHASISEILPSDATLALDGSIYILDKSSGNNKLFQYLPETDEVKYINYRLEPQPLIQNLFVDHRGNLWAGGLGWLESDGSWYQMIRSPLFVTTKLDLEGDPIVNRWVQPTILLESSDDTLWFVSPNGMFSLDIREEKWCWFSTYLSNVIEDPEKNLWLIANGKLFKRSLAK